MEFGGGGFLLVGRRLHRVGAVHLPGRAAGQAAFADHAAGRGGLGSRENKPGRAGTGQVLRISSLHSASHLEGARIERKPQMSIIAWLVVGLVAGWIGSMIVNRGGEGPLLDIVLGIVGAFVGGFLFNMLGHSGVSGINFYSIFVAVVGSIVVLVIYHALFRRRAL